MRYSVGIGPSNFNKKSGLSSKSGKPANSHLKYRKIMKRSPFNKKGSIFNKRDKGGKKSKTRKALSKVFGIFLGIMLIGAIGVTIYVGSSLASISSSLPDPNQLINRASDQSTQIFDRNGTLLYTVYGDQNREFVSIDQIPAQTKWALLAAEDMEFYDHKGLDIKGIISAAYRDLVKNETIGASTITQQLVRNTLLYDFLGEKAYERSISRKVKEMLITMQLEQTLNKDQILQMYMNEIPLGGTNYGFQAAAKAYFGKDVSQLDLAESAILAGIIQAPGYYSPLFGSHPEEAVYRQTYVLDQLYQNRDYIQKESKKQGQEFIITQEMIDNAKNEVLAYSTANIDIKAPHFVFYVKQLLEEEYGVDRVERGGLKVTTTLDYGDQQIAEEEVRYGVDQNRDLYNVNNGSLIAINPRNGDILAMVGSYDYFAAEDPRVDGNVNITTALRQMGSSTKPYTYLTALNQGYTTALLTPDIPLDFGTYKADNWDGSYYGLINMRYALVESRNMSALYTMDLIGGPDAFIKTAETLGITTLTNRDLYGVSLTLGAGEMKLIEHTAAYGVFAAEGVMHPTRPVLKVETYDGEDITAEKWKDSEGTRVWDEKEIYLLNWILCDLSGEERIMPQYYRTPDQGLCGKTGTTNGPTDLTAFLYYPNLVVGVWTGNNNNDFTNGYGGQGWSTTVPLPIANAYMTRMVPKYGVASYGRPGGIVNGTFCKETGLLAKEDSPCTKLSSVFIEGHLPPVDDSFVKKPICKETGKIATNEQEANAMGLIEYKTFLNIKLPGGKHQGELDAWLSNSSTYGSMSKLPDSDVCPLHLGPGNAPTIRITSPAAGAEYDKGQAVPFTVTVNSLHGVTNVEYFFDGASIGTSTTAPYSYTYAIPSGASTGDHTILARVTDIDGKTGEASVTISVKGSTPVISISIQGLSNGQHITLPYTFSAKATGDYGNIEQVVFVVMGPTGTTLTATKYNGGQTWKATWPSGFPSGSYTVYAQATVTGGVIYQSSPIDVVV